MRLSNQVKKILSNFSTEAPGIRLNVARLLMEGRLGGTGKLLILAVDQGFEHGPRAFVMNPQAFDPLYHAQLAVEGGMSGYAAPLGALSIAAETYWGRIPLILKMNNGCSLGGSTTSPDQALTATIQDALHFGCTAIGFTLYPGSPQYLEQCEEFREIAAEAKSCGLAVIAWSYPRGNISKAGETALDVVAYGAHMACQLGAHIVKVKLPTETLEMSSATNLYQTHVPLQSHSARVQHVVQSCFQGKRLVIFSGGETKNPQAVIQDAKDILAGGGHGAIIGRNCFQRPKEEALQMVREIQSVLKGQILKTS